MNEKARKYIDLFRKVKIATAATVDEKGHPQARIINVMLAEVHYKISHIRSHGITACNVVCAQRFARQMR